MMRPDPLFVGDPEAADLRSRPKDIIDDYCLSGFYWGEVVQVYAACLLFFPLPVNNQQEASSLRPSDAISEL